MIDWHSHILPGMDDGSRNVEESLALLSMQAQQGIDTVIATSHFYADAESPEAFLKRRQCALEKLRQALDCTQSKSSISADSPGAGTLDTGNLRAGHETLASIADLSIIPGAEVAYYPGISRMKDLDALCIQGTKLLLLEMPMTVWTEYTVRELVELSGKGNVQILMAHVNRYLNLQETKTWDRVFGSEILLQTNASFFNAFGTKRKALSLLKEGHIDVIGSDCHNTRTRPPRIGEALEFIRKKMGEDFLMQMDGYGRCLLGRL